MMMWQFISSLIPGKIIIFMLMCDLELKSLVYVLTKRQNALIQDHLVMLENLYLRTLIYHWEFRITQNKASPK